MAQRQKNNASTVFETCTEQLSPFGGLLPLIKFFDLVGFKEIFDSTYFRPRRDPKLGHHLMVVGILMLMFIGFNRLWHFTYIRLDAMLCGFFRLTKLPVASTFWRYVDSLGINQANSFLKIIVKEEKVFDALEWLAAMCSHCPNKGEQVVKYYGHYSNVSRGKRKKQNQDELIPSILEPMDHRKSTGETGLVLSKKFTRLIHLSVLGAGV